MEELAIEVLATEEPATDALLKLLAIEPKFVSLDDVVHRKKQSRLHALQARPRFHCGGKYVVKC